MTLSYEDGMATLRSMFPAWEPQVLAELLAANQGHLENTIDMALAMEPPPARPTKTTQRASSSPRSSSPRSTSASRTRVTLPDDFLRLPGYDHGDSSRDFSLSEQEQRDAELAEMIQNEIFRQQLMEDAEFQDYFGHQPFIPHPGITRARAATSSAHEKSAAEIASETLTTVGEKLSVMSDVMKKKMHEMYLRFQTRSDAPKQRDPKSHRPLMADDSDDEDDDLMDARARQNAEHMRHRHTQRVEDDTASYASPRSASSSPSHARRTNKKQD